MALPNTGLKVYPTRVLLEKVDPGEWTALDDANKQVFQLIISAGDVCMTTGGSIRDILLGMFPEGTTTGDAFRVM